MVAAEGGFHGRTMGALALTSKEAYRTPFEPLPGVVTFVPYGDADALAAAVDRRDRGRAARAGPGRGRRRRAARRATCRAAREVATRHGALLWLDEVQSGIGRTGRWFAHHGQGVTPDIVTVAKGLAGGIPVGACLGLGAAGDLLQPGNHGTTFGGNPVACAAALAVIGTIERDGPARATRPGWGSTCGPAWRPTRASSRSAVRGSGSAWSSPAATPPRSRPLRWRMASS